MKIYRVTYFFCLRVGHVRNICQWRSLTRERDFAFASVMRSQLEDVLRERKKQLKAEQQKELEQMRAEHEKQLRKLRDDNEEKLRRESKK